MINVTRPSMPSYEEYCEEIKILWESRWITNMGEKHKQFRKQLEEYLQVDNVGLFVNGHMAIEMALQALELKGEVITTPYTFASTTHAIVRNGLQPVFCDIKEEDCTIDPEKIRELITRDTCAIMPVHVYGNICDVENINKIAQEYNLKVIYDAAHAFGEKVDGISVGTFGDATCFSFHATKAFNSIEGGAVVYKEEEYGRKLYELKNFGIHGTEEILGVGANAKMNEFCAAMGICNLRHFDVILQKRRILWERYRELLNGVKGITLCSLQDNVTYNYSYFPIFIEAEQYGTSRNELQKKLYDNEVYARKYFYPITSEFQCYQNIYKKIPTPIALKKSNQVLTLPLYEDLNIEDVEKICDIILTN